MAQVFNLNTDGKRWRPQRIGIANDHVRVPYANGSSFASQFLYREFKHRGHEVTVIGPEDPNAREEELPNNRVLLSSLPLNAQPGVHLPLPTRRGLRELSRKRIDIFLGQTGTGMIDLGLWLRHTRKIPFLSVNTVHWASYYEVLFPEAFQENQAIRYLFSNRVIPWLERQVASAYNKSDGLVVLSAGLKQYWRDRGVECPIHVIPRSVDPEIFDREVKDCPFDSRASRGHRLVCVCRHSREKSLDRLLRIFAREIVPENEKATLTLVGDGPDHDALIALSKELNLDDRVFFEGEKSLVEVQAYYRHADIFAYTSLSETYGQVVSEALWSGLPVVAMNDGKGVQQQIAHEEDGILISPGPNESQSNYRFGRAIVELLSDRERRLRMGDAAERLARPRCSPDQNINRFYEAFHQAKTHLEGSDTSVPPSLPNTLPSAYHLARWTSLHVATCAIGAFRKAEPVPETNARLSSWDTTRVEQAISTSSKLRRLL